MTDTRDDFDNEIWDQNDEQWEKAQVDLRHKSAILAVEELATERFGNPATWVSPMHIGGYNIVYRIRVEGESSQYLVRRPIPCFAQFGVEKTLIEAATALYVGKSTNIPLARVRFHGNDTVLGPYIIMEYVEHHTSMSTALNTDNTDTSKTFVLNPDIDVAVLERQYQSVATCLLKLFKNTFSRIGSLGEVSPGIFSITSRPVTRNMNDMLQLGGIPRLILPQEDQIYDNAANYYLALADQHLAQLVFQQNDLVLSAHDCRNKYIARQLFRRLAKDGRLTNFGFKEDTWSAQSKTIGKVLLPAPSSKDSFRLYCDDFRAGNILLDASDNVAAIIDWEFTYAAPTQFSLDPPWWLLLDAPDLWDEGLADWIEKYVPRLDTWLKAMEKAEDGMTTKVALEGSPLSKYMRESWETGRFWLTYVARKSWAFDYVYWKFLDQRFFGVREELPKNFFWKSRLHLLSEDERAAMEPFVERKMEEIKERKIVEWDADTAKRRLAEVLFD